MITNSEHAWFASTDLASAIAVATTFSKYRKETNLMSKHPVRALATVAALTAAATALVMARTATPARATDVTWMTLTAVHSGMCLDIEGGALYDGARAQQAICDGGANQQWLYNPTTLTLTAAHSRKCLAVSPALIAQGAPIWQYTCYQTRYDADPLQMWKVSGPVQAGQVVTILAVEAQMCLDVAEGSKAAGAGVVQWPCSDNADAPSQQWLITPAPRIS